MPEDLKLSQIGSSPLPPPFRGLHSPGVRKHCQIIFACYFRKSSIGYAFQGEPLISVRKSLMLSASSVKFVKYFGAKTVAINTSLRYAHKHGARLPQVILFLFL